MAKLLRNQFTLQATLSLKGISYFITQLFVNERVEVELLKRLVVILSVVLTLSSAVSAQAPGWKPLYP